MSGLGLGFGAGGRTSDAGGSTLVGTGSALGTGIGTAESDVGTRASVDLIEVEQELFELPVRERVLYNKEIQTAAFDDDDDACEFRYPDPELPGMGDATRDDAGVLSGVLPALELSRSAVGAHTACPFCPFIPRPCMNIAFGPDPSGAAPGIRLE